MQQTELNEAVDVRVDFRGGEAAPRSFRREGRIYIINRLHAVWRDTEGEFRLYFFCVEADGALYQLRWRTEDNLWFVDHVILRD